MLLRTDLELFQKHLQRLQDTANSTSAEEKQAYEAEKHSISM